MVVHLVTEHFRRSPVPKDSLDHFYRSPWWVSLGADIVWLVVVGSWEIWTENEVIFQVVFKDFVPSKKLTYYYLGNRKITFKHTWVGVFRSMFLGQRWKDMIQFKEKIFVSNWVARKTLKWTKSFKEMSCLSSQFATGVVCTCVLFWLVFDPKVVPSFTFGKWRRWGVSRVGNQYCDRCCYKWAACFWGIDI